MSLWTIAHPIILAVLRVSVVAGLGFFLARRKLLHPAAISDLSTLLIQVLVPCLLFVNIAGGYSATGIVSAAVVILSGPCVLGVGYVAGDVLARIMGTIPERRKAVVASSTFQNSAYLPIAVSTAVLPALSALFPQSAALAPSAVVNSAVVDISLFGVLYSPLFWGLGLAWIQSEETGAVRISWDRLVTPPVLAVIAGNVAALTPLHRAFTPPDSALHFAFSGIGDVGGMTIPIANLILGAMLAVSTAGAIAPPRRLTSHTFAPPPCLEGIAPAVLGRLILTPILLIGTLWLTRGLWRHDAAMSVAAFVIALESISPPATNLAVMSKGGGSATQTTIAGILLVCYPLAMVTMPFWLTLFLRMLSAS